MRDDRWPLHGQQRAGPVQILLDMPIKGGGSRKRSHKARGITEQGADRQFFDRVLNEESRPMSVAQYYYTEYGCRWGLAALPVSRGKCCGWSHADL